MTQLVFLRPRSFHRRIFPRLTTAGWLCLIILGIPLLAWGDTIGKDYEEDPGAFTYKIDGRSFDSDDSHDLAEGSDWKHEGTITENAATLGDDELTVNGSKSEHAIGPHGEPVPGPAFKYKFFADAGEFPRGVSSALPSHSMVKRHGDHFDAYLATSSIFVDTGGSPDITDWDFAMTGKHSVEKPTGCKSKLDSRQEVPQTPSPAFGSASLIVEQPSGFFALAIAVSGITLDKLTAAHIHLGPPGLNGPVIFNLGSPEDWTDLNNMEGIARSIRSAEFPPAHLRDLVSGDTYINIHTVEFPGGEIRGQLIPLLVCSGAEKGSATYRSPDQVKFTGRNYLAGIRVEIRLFDQRGALEQAVTRLADPDGVVRATFRGVRCENKPHRVETDCGGIKVRIAENCL